MLCIGLGDIPPRQLCDILLTATPAKTVECCLLGQGLASRALAGRLQAGLEAYNRHATEEMDQLLEVQHKLIAREQQLQAIVSDLVTAVYVLGD